MSRAPLTALQAFAAAARMGNLTRAADGLHVTVSALSHQMRALEERLGRKLFVRQARGVTLTPEGQRLYDSVRPHLEAIERALKPFQTRCDDVLTLSLIPSVANGWLIPRLGAFLAAHPEIEINLQSTTHLVDFGREPIDAALRFGPGQWAGLVTEKLFDEWLTPVASSGLLARLGKPGFSDLGRWPLLDDGSGRWATWFRTYGGSAPERYVARFDDLDALHRAATEELGVALGRMTMAQPLLDAGRLVTLTSRRIVAESAHYLVYPERSREHRGLLVFREWLHREARGYTAKNAEAGENHD